MRNIATIRRKRALTASAVGFLITAVIGVTASKGANPLSTATINGPATVESRAWCSWDVTHNVPDPRYEWSTDAGYGIIVIGTDPFVSWAFDRDLGAHQGLKVRVYNLAGDAAVDMNLIGVFFENTGFPDCYDP
jgi:hypothetical protein